MDKETECTKHLIGLFYIMNELISKCTNLEVSELLLVQEIDSKGLLGWVALVPH